MGVIEEISDVIKDLPEPLAREVLEFAERVRASARDGKSLQAGSSGTGVAKPLSSLAGGLKQSRLFVGDPVDIQRQLRGEWR